jgi:hypothetical protein
MVSLHLSRAILRDRPQLHKALPSRGRRAMLLAIDAA